MLKKKMTMFKRRMLMLKKNTPIFKRKMSINGFSLVELMVVVAIIGILASIAVPNFREFRNRVRRAEVKTNLSSYYQSSKAASIHYGFYPGGIGSLFWSPEGDIYYDYNFPDNMNYYCAGFDVIQGLPANTHPTGGLPAYGDQCDDGCAFTNGGILGTTMYSGGGVVGCRGPLVSWTDKYPSYNYTPGTLAATGGVFTLDRTFRVGGCADFTPAMNLWYTLRDCWIIDERKNLGAL